MDPYEVREEISGVDYHDRGGCAFREICDNMVCLGRVCFDYREGRPVSEPPKPKGLREAT